MSALKVARPVLKRPTTWAATVGAYLVYAVLAWLLVRLIGLSGASAWVLRIALWLVGAVAGGLVLWFLGGRSRREGGEAATGGADDIDVAIAAAEARLAEAGARGGVRSLPLIVVVGPENSSKTSTVVHSGLDAELLAGEVYHGDGIGPTPGVNVWYTQRAVLVEMGGPLVRAPQRWARLLRRIRPRTLRATLTGKAQAPRAALVCYSCEDLLKPGEAVTAAAKELRALILRLAQGFGVQLPVYVLFTKADRIPHFADFAQQLTRDEAPQVLGATLRWPGRGSVGLYADREFQRLTAAFDRLLGALGAKRLDLLGREQDDERRAGAYEFPRELRKLVPTAVQFLVDLCRPTQLRGSPTLRGVYFSGVRAVVMSDAAAPAPHRPAAAPGRVAATQVFDAAMQQAAARPEPAVAARRVPQWLFLGALFRDVLLTDPAPARVARSARQVGALRRAGLAAVAAVSLILALGSTVAFVRNRDALAAARDLRAAVASETELPSEQTLAALETLRTHLDRLSRWRRWGLYKGTSLFPDLALVYQTRFNSILLSPARLNILRSLDSLPAAPTAPAQYGRAYGLLKAYLMVTSHPDRLDAPFVEPLLLERWLNGREADSTYEGLARAQFTFYADRLCRALPCGTDSDGRVVERTRGFLASFTGADRIYELIIAEAGAQQRPVSFTRAFPAAASLVAARYDVPPAFTPRGWAYMQDALQHVDRFFQADDWVLGSIQRQTFDKARLTADLRRRYVADYVRHWRGVLTAAQVNPFGGARDAAAKLAQLGGNQSPLLQLLAFVAQNTNVDSLTVGAAFQPVHAVMPPTVTNRLVAESNQGYIQALNQLQAAVSLAANTPQDQAIGAQTRAAAMKAKEVVADVALKFNGDSAASPAGGRVRTLLDAPIDRVDRMLVGLPGVALNQQGAAFCRVLTPLLAKYPFRPDALSQATVSEIVAMFEPGNGTMARFYADALQPVIVKVGNQYDRKAGAPQEATSGFVRFFNRLAAVTDAFWPRDAAGAASAGGPRLDFTVKLLPTATLPSASFTMDGQRKTFTRTLMRAERYSWVGASAGSVRLSTETRGRDETVLTYDGTWALFRLLQKARWQTLGTTSTVTWSEVVQGQPIRLDAELNLGAAWSILKGDYFTGLTCQSQVVQ